jgi:GNAT superfamily N-acetyltransferase
VTTGGDVDIRPVTQAHRDLLQDFSCRNWAEPWTGDVEVTVHMLADELGPMTAIQANGVWRRDDLLAVAAWRPVPGHSFCQCLALAVATGHRRRGYGRMLKAKVLDEARQAGCSVVISKVHWGNHAMLELNDALGANIEQIPGDNDYANCIIPL